MSQSIKITAKKVWVFVTTSVWAFPVILAILLLTLCVFKISGSSVGLYHKMLYGSNVKDPDLLAGRMQAIRSDEWWRSTQSTISQSKNNFPRVNKDILYGSDVSLSTLPAKDWSRIFMPETWAYFVMPLEFAFAARWWILLYLLAISCYFLALRLLPGNRLFAALLSLATVLSPYEIWWYKSGSYLVPAFGLFTIILFMRIINNERIPWIKQRWLSDGITVLLLAYSLGCLGLTFYPPYQIPMAIVVVVFCIGYLLQKKLSDGVPTKKLARGVGLVSVGVVISIVIGVSFLLTHKEVMDLASGSVYPGSRRITSGGMNYLRILSSFVMPVQQSGPRASQFIANQSEAANFIFLTPFLLIPGLILLVYNWIKHKKMDWLFLAIELLVVLFLIRMFLPYEPILFKLLLLDRVPNERLVLGLGFAGMLQLILVVRALSKIDIRKNYKWLIPVAYSALCFAALLIIGKDIKTRYPLYIEDKFIIISLAAAYTTIIFAFLLKMKRLGITLLLLFTLASVFKALPLYRGLGVLNDSSIITKIQEVSSPDSYWVTVGDDAKWFDNFGSVAGRGSLSGTQSPRPDFWVNYAGPSYEKIYNRQGNVLFTDNSDQKKLMTAPFANVISVKFQCGPPLEDYAQYALSVHPLNYSCVELLDTVKYPMQTFYLYKIVDR